MEKRKFNWRDFISVFLSICLVFTSFFQSSVVYAAGGWTGEEINGEIDSLNLEWSDYTWEAKWSDGVGIKVKNTKTGEEYKHVAYCYSSPKLTPNKINGAHIYRKTTINNETKKLLYYFITTRRAEYWKGEELDGKINQDAIIDKVLYVLYRGYSSDPVRKQQLLDGVKIFYEDVTFQPEDYEMYEGTKQAIWSIIDGWTAAEWIQYIQQNSDSSKVAAYLCGYKVQELLDKYGSDIVTERPDIDFEPGVVPDNIQVTFYDPQDRQKADYWEKDSYFQPIVGVEFVRDITKDSPEIHVEKTWRGVQPEQVATQPEVKVAIKRGDKFITYLKLNANNQWKASYTDEVDAGSNPVYTVVELDANNQEITTGNEIILDGKTYRVTITGDQTNGFTVTNTPSDIPEGPTTASVSIKKIGTDTNSNLTGAKLKITKSDNSPVQDGEWTTDGTEKTFTLEEGEYKLEEISAPEGYKLTEPIEFRITNAGKLEIKVGTQWEEQATLSITMKDDPIVKKDITIKKVASDTRSDLSGAKLKITKSDGSPVQGGEWVTDGTEKVFSLQEGEYTLQEVEVPEGYTKADDISFRITDTGKLEVKQDGVYKEQAELVITMVDNKIPEVPVTSHEITFSKVEVNKTEELEGATLRIYEGEVGVTPEVAPIKEWVSTKEQQKVSLQAGTYTMVEIQAPNGYEVAENIVFKVLEDGTIQVKENGNWVNRANATVQMQDAKIPEIPENSYELTFSKVEINTTNELEGATLQIFSGEAINVEPLHTWVSTKDQRKISLKEGIYTMVEKQAPDGYEVAENIVFQVLSNGAIQIKENGNWVERTNTMVRMEDKKKELPQPPTPPTPPTPPVTPPTPPVIPPTPPTEPNKPEEPKPEKPNKPEEPKPEKPSKPKEPKPEKPSKPKEPKPEKPSKPKEPKPEKPNEPETPDPNDPNYLMGLYGNRNPWELENADPNDPNYLMGLKGKPLGQVELQSSKNPSSGKFSIKGNIVGNGIQDSPKVVKTSDTTKLTWYVMTIMLSTMVIGFYLLRRKNMNK